MKKKLSIILTMTLTAAFLAGCGSKAVNNGAGETSSVYESVANQETTSSKAQEETSLKPPAESSGQAETESRSESASESRSESANQSQTQAPTQASTQAPTQAPTQASTQAPTQKPTPTEPATSKYIVDRTTESSSVTQNYKYGVKIKVTTYDYYNVYSDGSKVKYNTSSINSYDYSGYSATDAELMSESNSKAESNIAYYNEVLSLVNEIRAEAGVAPLTLDTTMCQAATMRAVEMNYSNQFSHTRPDGTRCFTVFKTYNISYMSAGENIAAGQRTPADVVTAWKNSSGHYANMVNEGFTKLGVGMSCEAPGSYGHYWVQLFAR